MKPFTVARLRLERANAHGKTLADAWNAIPNDHFFRIRSNVEPDGTGTIRFTEVKAVPDELALILGETLYQLRSALDACIYQASVYSTGKNPPPDESKMEFPITNDEIEFPKLAKRRLFHLAQDVQDGVERVQPYNFAKTSDIVCRSLGILNDLARKDRHRKLHIFGCWPTKTAPVFTFPPGVHQKLLVVSAPTIIREGTVLATFELEGVRKNMGLVQVNPNLATQIALDELPLPTDSSDTWDSRIVAMINSVNSVILAFENHY
jgi:hypothetical protein